MQFNNEFINTMAAKGKVKATIGHVKTASKLKTSQKIQLLEIGYSTAKELKINFPSQEELMMHLTKVVHLVHKG